MLASSILYCLVLHHTKLHTPFLIFLISGCPGLRGWLEPTAEGERWYSDGVCVCEAGLTHRVSGDVEPGLYTVLPHH